MLSFLLAVHFVLTISIIGLILLQKHDSDGALGSSGGGAASGMFSVRGQANLLTRSTAVLMAIFILNCLLMAKIVRKIPHKGSIIDRVANESVPSAPLPPADKTKGNSTTTENNSTSTNSNGTTEAPKNNGDNSNNSASTSHNSNSNTTTTTKQTNNDTSPSPNKNNENPKTDGKKGK